VPSPTGRRAKPRLRCLQVPGKNVRVRNNKIVLRGGVAARLLTAVRVMA